MQAIVQNGYGSPDILELKQIDTPVPQDGEVLVRVHATALHAGDYFSLKGVPYGVRFAVGFPRPKDYIPGYDVAGVVEAVGEQVTRFRPGDEVFGACSGGCAEYVATAESNLVSKPANLSFEQAGCVATSALAALHGLRDAGHVQPGMKVLVNGASGGVGIYAVQIAKALGADVTGVCSGRNADMVRSIGADHVVDYTQEDFTQNGAQYDLILDNVASRTFAEYKRALTAQGKVIPNSGHAGLGYVIKAMARSLYDSKQGRPYLSSPKQEDLVFLRQLLESGQIKPVIDRTYRLEQVPEAMRYVGAGHASGKVVITVKNTP